MTENAINILNVNQWWGLNGRDQSKFYNFMNGICKIMLSNWIRF